MNLELIKFTEAMARDGARHLIAAILSGVPPDGEPGTIEDYVTRSLQTLHALGKCEAYAEMCRPVKGGDDGNG